MGYNKAKGRGKTTFVMLRHDIMRSAAWRSLSPKARCVWTEVVYRFNGNNNGEIPLSCREAGELCNISKNTAWNGFIELQDRGFIKIGEASNFNRKTKRSTRWILTHETFDEKPASNDWKKWKKI